MNFRATRTRRVDPMATCWLEAMVTCLPGGPRGLLPQGSHKSVRAQLRHTARQVTVSLRAGKLNGLLAVSKAGMLSRLPASDPSTKDDWNVVPTTCAKCV